MTSMIEKANRKTTKNLLIAEEVKRPFLVYYVNVLIDPKHEYRRLVYAARIHDAREYVENNIPWSHVTRIEA